ncbi:MAG: hypothetical protein U0175_03350 [Caldilineaceae bacterium]
MFQNFGRSTLADLVGDWVVYRNLEPLDKRVPGLKNAGYRMGMTEEGIPRKLEKEYAKAALWICEEARTVSGFKKAARELLLIGDTLVNDGTAHRNLLTLSGWEGSCFIGADRMEQEPRHSMDEESNLYLANRWSLLPDWLQTIRQQGLQLDASTIVIVDIDKTALGPKGRNDQVIDQARLEGIFRTMDSVLGERFDRNRFVRHYSELNRARYHFLTADNQDYLAYICLILNADLIDFDELSSEIEAKNLENFDQFLRWVDSLMMRKVAPGDELREVHEAIQASVRNGDPTPFKRFRRQEFVSTLEHMGSLPDGAAVETLLRDEITLCEEVWQAASWLKERGCFLICMSDKPDEASRPGARDAVQLSPIHRTATHRVGVDLRPTLKGIK